MQQSQIQAEWKAPADAKTGDSFELLFPEMIKGVPASFDLLDEAGKLVASCKIETTKIVCTFTDYVETHDNVTGSLRFTAEASKQTTEEEWTWNKGTDHEFHTHIDGGVGPFNPTVPTESFKDAWRNSDGSRITWQVLVLGKDLITPGGNTVELVDTYDQRLSIDQSDFVVQATTPADFKTDKWTLLSKGTGAEQYTVAFGTNSYTLNIHGVDPAKIYRVLYFTPIPAGTVPGDTFSNKVKADGKDFVEKTYTYQSASGDGGGDQKVGVVTWNKVDPAGKALAGSEWTITGPDGTSAPVVDNGENDKDPADGRLEVRGLSWGSYTLTETKAPAGYALVKETKTVVVDGRNLNVSFGDIVNTPEPTKPTEPTEPTTPTAPTEPAEPTTPTSPTEPTEPGPPTGPTVPTEPTQPIQATTPTEPPLARTGAAVTGLAVAAGLLALVGAATVFASKRRRHQ